jgi:hypothetical protein
MVPGCGEAAKFSRGHRVAGQSTGACVSAQRRVRETERCGVRPACACMHADRWQARRRRARHCFDFRRSRAPGDTPTGEGLSQSGVAGRSCALTRVALAVPSLRSGSLGDSLCPHRTPDRPASRSWRSGAPVSPRATGRLRHRRGGHRRTRRRAHGRDHGADADGIARRVRARYRVAAARPGPRPAPLVRSAVH